MDYPDISLLAVFLTGLLGGVHCAGMCGGIVSALGMLKQRPVARSLNIPVKVEGSVASVSEAGSSFAAVAAYNLGRIAT